MDDIATFSLGAHITLSYVKWTKPGRLARLDGAKFQLVTTNSDQSAMNKATKKVLRQAQYKFPGTHASSALPLRLSKLAPNAFEYAGGR